MWSSIQRILHLVDDHCWTTWKINYSYVNILISREIWNLHRSKICMKLTTDFTVLRGFVRVVTTSVVTCAKNLETGTKFVLRSVKSRNVLCQLVIITAALLHLPLLHLNGQYSPAFFFRYSRLHDCSGSSLPSLQSKMELQNECSGTQVPSLHLKPLPGHSEMVER